jgi:hypothetical protein
VRVRADLVHRAEESGICSRTEFQYTARNNIRIYSRGNRRGSRWVPTACGGIRPGATILAELAEKIDPKRLVAAAKTAPLPWAQRLGYLLELLDAKESASLLKTYVHENARDWTPLVPGARRARARRADDWLLYVNADVESEA